jgi:hypothetical protein
MLFFIYESIYIYVDRFLHQKSVKFWTNEKLTHQQEKTDRCYNKKSVRFLLHKTYPTKDPQPVNKNTADLMHACCSLHCAHSCSLLLLLLLPALCSLANAVDAKPCNSLAW